MGADQDLRGKTAGDQRKRRICFLIRLADFQAIRTWKLSDADTGKDLAREIRDYFIPDDSNWKDHDSFEAGFTRLLKDLKSQGPKGRSSEHRQKSDDH